ncbi:MAG: hypothetical protein KatS3mg121_0154 [Gammaproteobacteria bacterium]|nr:MAG: hypothetical protein KatS3mg121_0154 [Gammaproteobacteria bacterium]
MHAALKQRLVGAVILVALGVIFIPMLFERDPVGRQTVSLEIPPPPGEEGFLDPAAEVFPPPEFEPPAAVEPVIEAEHRAEGVPHRDPDTLEDRPQPVPPPAPVERSPAAAPAAVEAPAAAPDPGQAWWVQVGSFSRAANAAALRDRLRKAGIEAQVFASRGATGPVYRVRVGPLADRDAAEARAAAVRAAGDFPTLILAPGAGD